MSNAVSVSPRCMDLRKICGKVALKLTKSAPFLGAYCTVVTHEFDQNLVYVKTYNKT